MSTFFNTIWNGTKNVLVFIITLIIVTLLSLFITFSALSLTVADREYMSEFVSSNEFYTVLTKTAPKLIEYEGDKGEQTTFNDVLKENQADKFIEEHFDYEFYDEASREFIAGVFNWLEGKSEKPDFEIAIAESEEEFIDLFADAYWLRISQLPACESPQQMSENVFELRCKPQGINIEDVKSFLIKNKNNPEFQEFMQAATINGEDLELEENAQNIPAAFRFIKWSPLIFLAIGVVFTYLLCLIYRDRHEASKKIGKRIAINSGIIGLFSLLVIFGYNMLNQNLAIRSNQPELMSNVLELVGVIIVDIAQISGLISFGFVLVGLILFEYGSKFFQRRFLEKQ